MKLPSGLPSGGTDEDTGPDAGGASTCKALTRTKQLIYPRLQDGRAVERLPEEYRQLIGNILGPPTPCFTLKGTAGGTSSDEGDSGSRTWKGPYHTLFKFL